jgi:RNA recognition motif-containing protein
MGKKLSIGNLTFDGTDGALEQLYSAHGAVESAQVIMDRVTGRSKGIGFVEMKSDAEVPAAIQEPSGHEFGGRALTVNEARPKTARGGHGGFRGGRRDAGRDWGGYGGRRY